MCEIIEWKKCADRLHDENLALKEEREEVDGIIQGLYSQIAAKDRKLKAYADTEQCLRSKHEKQLTRMRKKHDNATTLIETKLHSAEQEILLYRAAEEGYIGKEVYYEAKISTLRGLNMAIMEKLKEVQIARDALELIVAHSKIPDLTPEVCRLKAEVKELQNKMATQ